MVSGDEEVCTGVGILLVRKVALVVNIGRGRRVGMRAGAKEGPRGMRERRPIFESKRRHELYEGWKRGHRVRCKARR
jgi:hypothetical protein